MCESAEACITALPSHHFPGFPSVFFFSLPSPSTASRYRHVENSHFVWLSEGLGALEGVLTMGKSKKPVAALFIDSKCGQSLIDSHSQISQIGSLISGPQEHAVGG